MLMPHLSKDFRLYDSAHCEIDGEPTTSEDDLMFNDEHARTIQRIEPAGDWMRFTVTCRIHP